MFFSHLKSLAFLSLLAVSNSTYAIYISTDGSGTSGQTLPKDQPIPAMVSILDGYFQQSHTESVPLLHLSPAYFEHDCAGTIIAIDKIAKTFYVVTSAHCLSEQIKSGIKVDGLEDKIIVLGNNWMTSKYRYFGALDQLSAIYIYKDWVNNAISGKDAMDGDVAILALSSATKPLPKNLKPMKLANPNQAYGEDQTALLVAGWGTTNPQEIDPQNRSTSPMTMTQTPNYAAVTAVPDQACGLNSSKTASTYYSKGQNTFPFSNNDLYFCAGLPSESTACYGDSGGPLFKASKPVGQWDPDTQFTLYGTVDYSPALCNPETPHTYTFPPQLLCRSTAGDKNWYEFTNQIDTSYSHTPGLKALPAGLLKNSACERAAS